MVHAVLTGDIVNSTLLDQQQERKLMKMLQHLLTDHKHEFFRGDSFQVYIKDPSLALKIALQCRTAAIGLNPESTPPISDVRISIGIGSVDSPVRILATAKGEAPRETECPRASYPSLSIATDSQALAGRGQGGPCLTDAAQ